MYTSGSNRGSVKLCLHLAKATSFSETIHDDVIDDVDVVVEHVHSLSWDQQLTTV